MYASYSTQLKKYKEIIKCCPPTVIKVTYDELEMIIAKNKLSPGSTYLITDYQTIYDQPDFDTNFTLKTTIPTLYGTTEPLFVTAVSTQFLSETAKSLYYPDDIIKYKTGGVTPFNYVATKGTILYREDSLHNSTWYDFRHIVFKRYIVSGHYVVNDPGTSPSTNCYTFSTGCYNIQCDYINKSNQLLPNNIFPANSYNIKTGINFCNNTFKLPVTNTSFQNDCCNNLFLNLVNDNEIQHEFTGNTVEGIFTNNTIQNGFMNNVTTGSFVNNTIENNFSDNEINTFTNNTIKNNFSNNKQVDQFTYNIVESTFSSNVISSNFQYNHVCTNLTGIDLTPSTYSILYTSANCNIISSSTSNYIVYLNDTSFPIVFQYIII